MAIAVLSFLLFPPLHRNNQKSMTTIHVILTIGCCVNPLPQISPPLVSLTHLYVPQRLLAYFFRSSLLISVSTTSLICISGTPLSRANITSSSRPVIRSIRASNCVARVTAHHNKEKDQSQKSEQEWKKYVEGSL